MKARLKSIKANHLQCRGLTTGVGAGEIIGTNDLFCVSVSFLSVTPLIN